MKFFSDMNDNTKFWSIVIIAITQVVVVLILSILSYNKSQDNKISAMVEKGYSPQEAQCAFFNSGSSKCIVIAALKGSKGAEHHEGVTTLPSPREDTYLLQEKE